MKIIIEDLNEILIGFSIIMHFEYSKNVKRFK